MNNSDRGALGESFFRTWCTQAEMTVVKAEPDKFGWDFHVTLHEISSDRGPHELREAERQCKVQIKTTTPEERSVPMTLSNWERMAKEQVAWFVVIILVERAGKMPCGVFLVHIDEEQIAKVLRRLRQHDVKPDKNLNEIEMSINYGDTDRLSQPWYESLRAQMLHYLGANEAEYVKSKDKWRRTVGFDQYPVSVRFNVVAPTEDAYHEMWANWSIGLLPDLPVKNMRMEERRFNIAKQIKAVPEARISLPKIPSTGPATLQFFNTDRTECVVLRCDTRTSAAVAPWLPQHHRKIQFLAPYFSLLVAFDQGQDMMSWKWSFHFPIGGARGRLSELAPVGKILRLAAQAKKSGLHLTIDHQGEMSSSTTIDLSSMPTDEIEGDLVPLALSLELAGRVAANLGLDAGTIEVDPEELWRHRLNLVLFAASVDRTLPIPELRFVTAADKGVSGKKSATVHGLAIPLGEHIVFGVCTVTGMAEWEQGPAGSIVSLRQPALSLRYREIVPYKSYDVRRLDDKIQEAAKVLSQDGGIEAVFAPNVHDALLKKDALPEERG